MTFQPSVQNARVQPVGSVSSDGTITRGGPETPLRVKRVNLTFDRTWSPYLQGTIVCALQTAAEAKATDPRSGLNLVKFRAAQADDGAAAVYTDYAVWLRQRSSDPIAGETTLEVASIESLMQDHVDGGSQSYSDNQQDTTILGHVLNRMPIFRSAIAFATYSNPTGAAAFTVAAADAGWDTGTSVWDAANTMESAGGLWLRGDTDGTVLYRVPADYSADSRVRSLTGSDRIISVVDTVNRDSPDWANTVFITYTYNKGTQSTIDYGASGNPVVYKSVSLTRNGRKVANGEAAARAARMAKRGRSLQVTAILDLACRPNQTWYVKYGEYAWTGVIRTVTFRYPDGLMDLTFDVIES